jgi:hypothetical protein
MYESPYVQCPACRKVVFDPGQKLVKLDELAPCCGSSGQPRIIWPSFEALKFLEIVSSQDLSSPDGRRIAIVFLCTVLELLLEDSLWELLEIHTNSRQLADAVLDSYRGRDKRIQLYNKLSDRKLKDLLQAEELLTFFEDWEHLSQLRNDIVHGQYSGGTDKEVDCIRHVSMNCLSAFVAVNNDIQRQRMRQNQPTPCIVVRAG